MSEQFDARVGAIRSGRADVKCLLDNLDFAQKMTVLSSLLSEIAIEERIPIERVVEGVQAAYILGVMRLEKK